MSTSAPVRIAGLTAAVAVTGLLGYAVYFDYMRRNSTEFRRGLRRQEKKLVAAAEAQAQAKKEANAKALKDGLIAINSEPVPTNPDQIEAYFAEQASEGEKFATMGPDFYVPSALCFFRALRVYHSPGQLLEAYQRIVPGPILALILELIKISTTRGALDVPERAPASVEDIDDTLPSGDAPSPNSASQGSGAEWEKVSEE
ncbi:hypothetical protein IAT38_003955 [Cryptococcus sp. DSM 104549]